MDMRMGWLVGWRRAVPGLAVLAGVPLLGLSLAAGAATGRITVTVPAGTATSTTSFTVT
jgi:hypothetical protein